jgi:lysyl-tRNA synthetase class II
MSGNDETETDSARHGLNELIDERRAKGHRLREDDPRAFPYSFPNAEPIAGILEAYEHLENGQETEDAHRVAGRIAARRGSGKATFLDLVDRTGKVQLHARVDVLGEDAFARLTSLDLGDLIGVDGAPLRSRRGELSLRVDRFQVLAKALRPPPDKHHGLSDVETRYRRRELDLIASEDARKTFIDRAKIISAIRGYPSCSRCTAARSRGRSPRITTRSTATCTCGSPPSCTSSACSSVAWSASTSSARTFATRDSRRSTTPSSR